MDNLSILTFAALDNFEKEESEEALNEIEEILKQANITKN